MTQKNILYTILVCINLACNPKKPQYSAISEIQIDPKRKINHSYSDIFDTIKYIPFKTSHGFLMKSVDKIVFNEGFFYIIDFRQSKLFIVNQKGELVGHVGNRGNGPGEFVELTDFAIDKENKKIHTWDNGLSRLTQFSLQGDYLANSTVYNYIRKIACFKGTLFFDSGFTEYNYNSKNHMFSLIQYEYKDKPKFFLPFGKLYLFTLMPSNVNHFFLYANELLFITGRTNIIYAINAELEVSKKYSLDFGKYKVPDSFFERHLRQDNIQEAQSELAFKHLPESEYCYDIGNIAENSAVLYFHFRHGKNIFPLLFNKLRGDYIFLNRLKNDIEGAPALHYLPAPLLLEDQLIFAVDAATIKGHLNGVHSTDLQKLNKSLTVNDNPVLCVLKFKQSFLEGKY